MLLYISSFIFYRFYVILPLFFGLLVAANIDGNVINKVIGLLCGIFYGFIIKILIKIIDLIIFKVYSITLIKRNRSHKIHARIKLVESEEKLKELFIKDLSRIGSDYNKPGFVLNTETHRLFVYFLIKEFISEKIANEFSEKSKAMKLNDKISFKSDDNMVKIVVKYYVDKVNTNTAIKKLIRFKSLKSDISNLVKNIKKNSRKIKYYTVEIHIG